jgi:copper chaperone NosL
MKANTKLSGLSQGILILCSLLLLVVIFVPMWRIDLQAPQYPEGLSLTIFPDKLGGNVDIINGLNHYIGMKTLHADDFLEFKILPYLIGGFSLFALLTALAGGKRVLYVFFASFAAFGVIAMCDFWRWEYNYGHTLDPNAAIVVPGMAYQPPLVGFKQLLNFGAYSIPSLGGWLFVATGVLLVFSILRETKVLQRRKKKAAVIAAVSAMVMASCSSAGPEPIKLNADACDFCKMTISELRFAAEFVTRKNRVYKFDDVACMKNFTEDGTEKNGHCFVTDHDRPAQFISVSEAFFVTSAEMQSPMGGNTLAFGDRSSADSFAVQHKQTVNRWEQLHFGN